ncbi:MAG: M36 family metallopeptidase, partial [Verrucomicrobiota bacterium]
NKSTANRAALVAKPIISAPEAIVLAAENIGATLIATDIVPLAPDPEGAEKRQGFRATPLNGKTRVRLTWLPMNRSSLRLCWQVELTSRARGELYRVLINAQTGDALIRHCLTLYLSEATYRVFISDSPTPFSPGYRTPSSVQPAIVERQLVTLSALSTNASPNGWINDGGNELRGNNVDAHLDRNDDDQADLPRPQGAPQRVFDFPMDLDKAPASSGNAAIAQLFYWNNWMHDKLYDLGFTEAAGNFQKTNFDRGGVGNDAVEADAQDGGGFNNANFSASSDGIPARMQMYIFNGPTPDRDGALDAEIVLHEYTHGLSTRLVGGGEALNELQSAGMGEGWSDFYALALLSESADELDGNYAMGAYASYQFGQLNENYYYGIRRYPYTTDLARNPLTFKDLDSRQADRHTGVPLSPLSGPGDFAEEVHNQGEVWCVTLWDARANLIKKWGFEAGNQLILQLVTDGMKLTPPNPNFLEARDAILQADRVKTGGANRDELWAAFAKRGLGFNASSPTSSTTSGVIETFDVPDDLFISPASGLTSTGPDGGPFSPASQTYSLSNVGTNVIDWSATWTAAWLDVSITNGTILPGAAPIPLTVQLNSIVNSLPAGLYDDTVTFTNLVSGKSQARKVALRVGQPDYFTRLFADEDNDLDFQSITFTPDGSKDYYSVCRETATAFPTDPSAGAILSLADDDFAKVVLGEGAHVSLYGTNYTSFYVSANGSVTFTQGVSEFQESLEAHFSLPRVSILFDDLDPSFDGLVSWTQLPDLVAVTFENVPNFFEASQNSFQLEMFFDGRTRLTYLEIGSTGGLHGLSNGKGSPDGFVETDFKNYGACLPVLIVNLPESVTEAQPGATGTVVLP